MFAFNATYAYAPPGTTRIKINNQVCYVDKTEIKNIDWKEFVWSLANCEKAPADYVQKMQIDSVIWKQHYGQYDIRETGNLPAIGITLEQAKAYCEWRSQVVNIKYEKKQKVQYSLITEEQYQYFSTDNKILKKLNNKNAELTATGTLFLNDAIIPINQNTCVTFRCIAVFE